MSVIVYTVFPQTSVYFEKPDNLLNTWTGNLGDLEEISPSIGRPSSETLFNEAISANRNVYSNHHVYPYTYQAGHYYRSKDFVKALQVWAEAADVIRL